jgi:hypothetical protein
MSHRVYSLQTAAITSDNGATHSLVQPRNGLCSFDEGKEPMKHTIIRVMLSALVLFSASSVSAQLVAAKDGPIVYGHHHLNVTSIDETRKFLVDALGGAAVQIGASNGVKFTNVFIFLRPQAPTGGTKGTTVNHIGFSVSNLRQAVDRVKANGYLVVTRAEVAATQEVKDGIAMVASANLSIAFVMAQTALRLNS